MSSDKRMCPVKNCCIGVKLIYLDVTYKKSTHCFVRKIYKTL